MNSDEKGQCRLCHKMVLWALTENSKLMPVDPGEVEGGNLELFRGEHTGRLRVRVVKPGEGKHVAHFATCEKYGKKKVQPPASAPVEQAEMPL
jgi:hypothetical protein